MALLPRCYLLEVETLCQSRLPSPIAMGEGLGARAGAGVHEALIRPSTSSRMRSAPSTITRNEGSGHADRSPFPAANKATA
jgi:hypothetical protein